MAAGRGYSISLRDLISTKKASDGKRGNAGARSSVTYALFVKNRAGDEIFEKTIGDDLRARLLAVRDRFTDVRIPIELRA